MFEQQKKLMKEVKEGHKPIVRSMSEQGTSRNWDGCRIEMYTSDVTWTSYHGDWIDVHETNMKPALDTSPVTLYLQPLCDHKRNGWSQNTPNVCLNLQINLQSLFWMIKALLGLNCPLVMISF